MPEYLQPCWPAPEQIRAYTTTRELRVNPWPDPNAHLSTRLQLTEPIIWINQVHGATVLPALPENLNQAADATYTNVPHRICAVLTADCLPILLCNQQGTVAAAIHAGWRGLAAGIVESTVRALNQPGEHMLAWLGPAIGPQKFEVGEDVYHAFTRQHQEAETAFMPHTPQKWLADLYALARLRLRSLGIAQIFGGNFCTYTQAELFFSHRRDHGKTGRMATLIWIEGKKR